MDKEFIIQEIRRIARANGGKARGMGRFFNETGIKPHEWKGKYWARWGDAVIEAGFAPNQLQSAIDEEMLLKKYVAFVEELGHLPVEAELQLKCRKIKSFQAQKLIGLDLAERLISFSG